MFVRLGALATILALGLDPFAQQLVQLRQSQDAKENAATFPYDS